MKKGLKVKIADILECFVTEMKRAEKKHPGWPTDPIHAAAILQEEAGELAQAANQFVYEVEEKSFMKEEAIQVGAMALRFLLNFDHLDSRPSEIVNRKTKKGIKYAAKM